MAPRKIPVDWDQVKREAPQTSSLRQLADRMGLAPDTMRKKMVAEGNLDEIRMLMKPASSANQWRKTQEFPERVSERLAKIPRNRRVSVEELADDLDVAPRRVREVLPGLREKGYRIGEDDDDVSLQHIAPVKHTLFKVLAGSKTRFGVVSDTHLNSNEEALDELNAAYDIFQKEGITEVWHAGDLSAGRGVYRGQDAEIKNHTFDTQRDYCIQNYPVRDGIKTRMIGGNHDLEGEFGKIGADLVQAVSNEREDVEYLGPYSAWINLATKQNPCWIHLLHGKGGGSYAFSYQAQKLAEGYAPGRKPACLILGHFHRKGNIEARGIEVIWPGCFEHRSSFMERLGLTPTVGFYILEFVIAKDGSLVQFIPHWHRFWPGRMGRG